MTEQMSDGHPPHPDRCPQRSHEDSYATTWAIVLAGGQGTRLGTLTTAANGISVPKQFCSLRGGACLLQEALIRASAVAPMRRICAVVAAQHRRWWNAPLKTLPKHNVVVQPENRGTAFGILLPLLQVLARDPNANVVVLPADHHLLNEDTLARSLRQAADLAAADAETIYLLGAEPNEPDPEFGYIVPAERNGSKPSRVAQFVEKPDVQTARSLLNRGALWNMFILAASGRALLKLFQRSLAVHVKAMHSALGPTGRGGNDSVTLAALYLDLPTVDFSRDVLERHDSVLRVIPVPHCGWSDLGTPKRVAETLSRLPSQWPERSIPGESAPYMNLAAQNSRLQEYLSPGFASNAPTA
jgi:mannose-1-phosphate guanylyltransferase